MTVNGAISPGDAAASPATLTISNSLVLNSTSALNYDLGTVANADKIAIVGGLTLDGTLNVTDAGSFGIGNYTLMTYTGSLVNNTLNVAALPGGFSGAIVAGSGTVVLQVTAGGGNPYTAFESHYGLTPGTGDADADQDGLSNTNEFMAGFNPSNHNAYVHITAVARSGANVVVSYMGSDGDSSYTGGLASRTNILEFTTGKANGSYTNNFLPIGAGGTNILSSGTGVGTVTSFVDTNGASGATKYYRVRVLVP